ncbi:MAG TPA: lipocalin [Rikenellaceae bacterium]|nr:lipocalin [Rikenellaceae bacterium]
MAHISKKLAVIAASVSLPLCLHAGVVENTPVASLKLSRFLGTWYEIARFDHSFERGMDHVTAEYVLRDDGKIDVLNSGMKNGKHKTAKGKAKQPDPTNEPALLKVSFFLFFYSDYRVLMIDDDYSVALVGSSSDKYLWILSRTPDLPENIRQSVLTEARRRGYDVSRLIWVDQDRHY